MRGAFAGVVAAVCWLCAGIARVVQSENAGETPDVGVRLRNCKSRWSSRTNWRSRQCPPTPPAAGSPAGSPPVVSETEVVAQPQAGPAAATPVQNEVTGPSILEGTVFQQPARQRLQRQPSSTVGTIVDVPDRIFPGTISTITARRPPRSADSDHGRIAARRAQRREGLRRGWCDPSADQFFIRGFEVTSQNWRKDGYLDPTYMPRDPANMQRVDVLAGPASVLYGAAQPAGTWNVTTKQAQSDAFAYGGFMTGSYGLQRYTFDVNTPLNKDGTVLFRINGAYQNGNTNVQTVFNERTFVAPTFTFVLDDDTSLTLEHGIPARPLSYVPGHSGHQW